MGARQSKEKKQMIEQQKALAQGGGGGAGKGAAVVLEADVIDSPNFDAVKEFPKFEAFFCPSAVADPKVHAVVRAAILQPKSELRLDEVAASLNGTDVSLILPLLLRNGTALQEICLRGITGIDMTLLTASLRYASSQLKRIDLDKTGLGGMQTVALVEGLKAFARITNRTVNSPLLEIYASNNTFFCTAIEHAKFNEQLASDVEDLENQFQITIHRPSIPEMPFEVNGQHFRVSDVDTTKPFGSTYLEITPFNLEGLEDADAKADFLVTTVSAIIRAQKAPNRPEGLKYIPRLFHLQRYNKTALTLVSENPRKMQNYVPIESLFSQATADQWSILWRMEIPLQVAHVCTFLHSLNAGLREVYPLELLVDMQQKRILYTQIDSLRETGVATTFHRPKAADRLRFADPAENSRAEFTLAKDLYTLAKLLIFFLIPIDNAKQFNTMFQPPLNLARDLSVPTQSYLKLLQERLAPGALSEDCMLQVAGLVAECTMKDELRRPSAAAFAARLSAIIKDAIPK